MTKINCDICGKEILTNTDDGQVNEERWLINVYYSGPVKTENCGRDLHFDLCEECYKKIEPSLIKSIHLKKESSGRC